jgi:plastocyanin
MKKLLIIAVLVGSVFYFGNQYLKNTQSTQAQSEIEESAGFVAEDDQVKETLIHEISPKDTFEIDMDDFKFSKAELVIKAGEEITIKLNNLEGNHDLVIDELDTHSEHFKPGESGEMKFIAGKEHIGKTYEFYCSVGSHRVLGMVGNITIVE